MSGTIGKSHGLSCYSPPPPKFVQDETNNMVIEKQGIVSILGTNNEHQPLRRTLSADMSSKKWLTQHGLISFSPMKKIASSHQLAMSSVAEYSTSSSDGEEEYEGKKEVGQFDVWSSILLSKKDDSSKLPPPYVHPLVKRSNSALSEKSLEICTESLGSETGSDGFSSCAPSETGDPEEDREEVQAQQEAQVLESQYYSFDKEEESRVSKRSACGPFPPPLPSLARSDGSSVQMSSHRENGRLVLEAMSIPSQNYFHAQRKDGRLVLTFANDTTPSEDEDDIEEMDQVFDCVEDGTNHESEEDEEIQEEEEEEEEEEIVGKFVMEQTSKLPNGVINVHRSALMIKKVIGLGNMNPSWTNKFNKGVNLVEMEMEVEVEVEVEGGPTPLPQSLSRPPRVTRLLPSTPATAAVAASFNTYEYFWRRTNPTVPSIINQQCSPIKNKFNKVILGNCNSPKAHEEQEMVLLRGNKADYLVPLVRGCKEPRRSLLIWEPYCIATS